MRLYLVRHSYDAVGAAMIPLAWYAAIAVMGIALLVQGIRLNNVSRLIGVTYSITGGALLGYGLMSLVLESVPL